MKKLICLLLVLASLMGTSAMALDVASSSIVMGSYAQTVWEVEGKSFTLRGKNSKTVKTKEGKFTFYADGTYHKGDKSVKKFVIPISASYDKRGLKVDVTVKELGSYMCYVSEWGSFTDPVKFSALTIKKITKDPKCLAYVTFGKAKKASLLQKDKKGAKTIVDIDEGTIVMVINKGKQYTKVNTSEFEGYIANGFLKFIEPAKNAYDITVKKGAQLFITANINGNKAQKLKEDTKAYCVSYNDEWCTIDLDGKRLFVQKKDTSMK